jgi:hypothetical protein
MWDDICRERTQEVQQNVQKIEEEIFKERKTTLVEIWRSHYWLGHFSPNWFSNKILRGMEKERRVYWKNSQHQGWEWNWEEGKGNTKVERENGKKGRSEEFCWPGVKDGTKQGSRRKGKSPAIGKSGAREQEEWKYEWDRVWDWIQALSLS